MSKPLSDKESSEPNKDATTEHDETVDPEKRFDPERPTTIPYGPSGIRGLFGSKYVLGAALLASLGGFSMGYDMGVISIINTMDEFHAIFPYVQTEFGKGLMTAMLLLGAFVGCLFMSYLADRISRKWALTVVVIVFDIGGILQTAAQNYAMLIVGRFIGGIGVGTLAMGAPIYISEIAPPELRGTLLVLESISINCGLVISYFITYGTRHMNGSITFRLPFGLQMVSATLLGLGIHFFPYSPRWLALVNRREECLACLCKLRGLPESDERVQNEYTSIITEIAIQNLAFERQHPGAISIKLEVLSWLDLFRRKLWKRTAVGVGVAFFQQFSGINAFIYYAPTLFQSLGQTSEMSLILSGVFNILQMLAVFVCFAVIDKVGRRPLAVWGGFGMAAAYILIAVLSGLYEDNWPAHMPGGWACVAMAFLFILIFGVSYSPLGWALPSEVYSNTTRSKGVALSSCVIWLSDFIVGVVTPSMLANIGYRTYIFFAVMCTCAGVWAFLLVPETSNKSLEEIDELFGDSVEQEERDDVYEGLAASRLDV